MSGVTSTGFQKRIFSDIRASVVTEIKAIPGMSRVNTGDDSVFGSIISGCCRVIAEAWDMAAEVYASWDADSATGRSLDNICALTGIYRRAAVATLVSCNVTLAVGTYAAGVLAASKPGYPDTLFVNRDEIVVSSGGVQTGKIFVCQTTGPIAVPTGTLTVIAAAYTGWSAITNPSDGVVGRDIETDAELRQRRIAGTPTGALASDERVSKVFVYENNTDATVDGRPPHSFEAIVYDGTTDGSNITDVEIAELLFLDKPAGIATVGDITETITDTVGLEHDVSFSRAGLVPIFLEVEIETNSDWDAVNGPALVRQALADYADENYSCGSDVRRTALFGPVYSVAGVENVVEVYLDTAASPSPNTTDLAIAAHEIPTFDTADITVTEV